MGRLPSRSFGQTITESCPTYSTTVRAQFYILVSLDNNAYNASCTGHGKARVAIEPPIDGAAMNRLDTYNLS